MPDNHPVNDYDPGDGAENTMAKFFMVLFVLVCLAIAAGTCTGGT